MGVFLVVFFCVKTGIINMTRDLFINVPPNALSVNEGYPVSTNRKLRHVPEEPMAEGKTQQEGNSRGFDIQSARRIIGFDGACRCGGKLGLKDAPCY